MEYLIRCILLLGFLAGLIFCIDLLESEKSGNIEYFDYDRDTRYGVITTHVNWDEAVILCKAKDARLAVLDTSDKARFVGRIQGERSLPYEDIWIGGIERGNAFYWSNNRPVNASVMKGVLKPGDFPVWLHASNRTCLAIDRRGDENPLFVNFRCVLKRAFLCEFNTTDTYQTLKGPNITDNHIHYFLYRSEDTWGKADYECRKMGLMLEVLDDANLNRLVGSRKLRTRPVVSNDDADPDIVDISRTFTLSKVQKSWDGAKKSCAEYYKTGTLVTLDESEGHEFLTEIMRGKINHLWQDMRSLWIGGRRKFDKNTWEMRWKWVWIDEDIANQSQDERDMNVNFTMYPPWAPKLTDKLDFDCLSLDRENHLQMFMYGLQCNHKQYYGCQHELGDKPLKRTYTVGRCQSAPGKVRAKPQSNGRSMEAGTTTGMTVESVLPEIFNALGHSGVLSTTPEIIGNNTDTG